MIKPNGATRHAMSVLRGQVEYYTDTQAWNGFAWQDVGNTHAYTSLLSEPPYLKTTRARSYSGALGRTKWSNE
jgi:hypothetical protein